MAKKSYVSAVLEAVSGEMRADPEMASFKAWRCWDDFEKVPLHGTFLVDAAGRIRWQEIAFTPFMDVAFFLAESRRLLALEDPRERLLRESQR